MKPQKSKIAPWWIVSSCVVLALGCDTCGARPPQATGVDVKFTNVSADGTTVLADTGRVEFPPTPMGTPEPPVRKLVVTNTGRTALTILGVGSISGDPVAIAAGGAANPVFSIAFPGELTLQPTQSAELDVSFSPPVTPGQRFVDHSALVSVALGDDVARTVELAGRAISDTCALPSILDFGGVEVGGVSRQSVPFDNQTPAPVDAFAGPITGAVDSEVFGYEGDSAAGDFVVQPAGQRLVRLHFRPTEQRDYFATVKLRRARGCPLQTVRLVGSGVSDCLTWTAAPSRSATGGSLDLDYVPPGSTRAGTVTFANHCTMPVELSALATSSAAFRVTRASAADLMRQTVPPGSRATNGALQAGTADVMVSFSPVTLGGQHSALTGATSLGRRPTFTVPLSGIGGGPDIELRPSAGLSFGSVPFFPGASPPPATARRLQIANVGTAPVAGEPQSNLLLGRGGAGSPYWDVQVVQGERDELCLGVFDEATGACGSGGAETLPATGPGSYDPAVGIKAIAGSAVLDVPVHVIPRSAGPKEFVVTFWSNDVDEPEVRFVVRANAVLRPPCAFDVEPAGLNFGIVTAPSTKDLAFKLRNRGAQPCFFSALELESGSDSTFLLPEGPVDELELPAGGERLVTVRAWPTRTNDRSAPPEVLRGAVVFNTSSQSMPRARVPLQAVLAVSCLVLVPDDLNFGTVQVGCASAERTVQLYNTCSAAVTVTGFRWLADSRVPQGVAGCARAGGCPEFVDVTTPAPGALAPGAVRSYGLRYRPAALGADVGAIAFSVQQGGVQLDYVATVRGRGDTTGTNEDVFRQQERASADLLFVVDNSCSMADKQAALAANFQSFVRYAVANRVDFQIGITTTDDDPNGEQGRLVASPSGRKLFGPSTPALIDEFAATVNVGTTGSPDETCLSPATRALTAPLVTDPATNGGLVRRDASLAVICVTDELEQAPLPNSHYMVQLLNVKGAHRPQAFTYNVIGPFTPLPSCAPDYEPPGLGRHSQAVAAGHGVMESICATNWSTALERLAPVVFGLRRDFQLTAHPSPSQPLQVLVDGVEVPAQQGGADVWHFDATLNQVTFEQAWVPEPGHVISVRYGVECFP